MKMSKQNLGIAGIGEKALQTSSKTRKIVGEILACCFIIPLCTCFVCNLAISGRLDWFFVVVASLLVVAAITVVPFAVKRRRIAWTSIAFSATTVLLLFVTCVFTGGDWFALASIPTIYGLIVLLLPFVLFEQKTGWISTHKGIVCMMADTIFLFSVIGVCGYYFGSADYWRISLMTSAAGIVYSWIVFLFCRYTKFNALIKAGILMIFSGISMPVVSDYVNTIVNHERYRTFADFDLAHWTERTVSPNVMFVIVLTCAVLGLTMMILGLVFRYNDKREADYENN